MADFHFLRPYWFIAFIPLCLAIWSLRHLKLNSKGWNRILPSHLASHLLVGKEQKAPLPILLIGLTWALIVVALAGPTWQKRAQPVFQMQAGKVIVLDLSMSMRADDIKPNRLTMARFKAIEIARKIKEGDIGLIGYAGDAFTISPLTPDNKNIINLIPTLSPEIMPVLGSDATLAISQAIELLTNAGYSQGDIFWITDGIHQSEFSDVEQLIADSNYKLLTLGVGTKEGAPIKLKSGELLKDSRGSIVIPKLNESNLQNLSQLSQGSYQSIRPDDSDIDYLIAQMQSSEEIKQQESQNQMGDQWQEAGPWLVLCILPFAAYAFRKGLIYSLLVGFIYIQVPDTVQASTLDAIFKTKDQQAYEALNQQDYQAAIDLAENQALTAAAYFKQGEYEKAAEHYQNLTDANSLYNLGNSYANLGKLDEAIQAYDKALQQQPNFDKARQNKALAEQMKQQQEQQNQQSDQNQDQQPSDENQSGDQSGDQQSNQNQSGKQDQSDSQNGENSQQDQSNQDNAGENNSDQQDHRSAEEMAQQQGSKDSENQNADQQNKETQQPTDSDQSSEPTADEQNQQAAQAAKPMTEAERAEQEQNEIYRQLLNKVDDDPSYLIRRKMQLEYEKRRRSNAPKGVTQPW